MKKTSGVKEKTKIMRWYRRMHHLYIKKHFWFAKLWYILIRIVFSCELPPSVVLGKDVDLKHAGLGTVFHKNAVVGDGTIIMHHVTIGGKDGKSCPIIGDNCFIGVGAVLLGEIKIGNNAKIGANSVVLKDVKENTTVVGAPAKPIQ